jgi:transketolase
MRKTFAESLIELNRTRPFVFLTGDLGFNALESLRDALGDRFINAGVSEQNMLSVAAGLSSSGHAVWAYSIAPFIYARPFEQIRNDICLHGLNVKIIGNGGGYGYGAMGATHHAIEDYGTLLGLPGLRAYVPAFSVDVYPIVAGLAESDGPAYLRLGLCELPEGFQLDEYGSWRKVMTGDGPVLLAVGPLAGGLIKALMDRPESARPEVWVVTELPVGPDNIPEGFFSSLRRSGRLCVAEEHVAHGSLGQNLAYCLVKKNISLKAFIHLHALGYPSGRYGSQNFHRKECGLTPGDIIKSVEEM